MESEENVFILFPEDDDDPPTKEQEMELTALTSLQEITPKVVEEKSKEAFYTYSNNLPMRIVPITSITLRLAEMISNLRRIYNYTKDMKQDSRSTNLSIPPSLLRTYKNESMHIPTVDHMTDFIGQHYIKNYIISQLIISGYSNTTSTTLAVLTEIVENYFMRIATHVINVKSDNLNLSTHNILESILSYNHSNIDDLLLLLMNDINAFKEVNDFQNDLFRSYQSDPASETIFNSFNNSNKWKEITSDPFPPNKLPFDPDKISNIDHLRNTKRDTPLAYGTNDELINELLL